MRERALYGMQNLRVDHGRRVDWADDSWSALGKSFVLALVVVSGLVVGASFIGWWFGL